MIAPTISSNPYASYQARVLDWLTKVRLSRPSTKRATVIDRTSSFQRRFYINSSTNMTEPA